MQHKSFLVKLPAAATRRRTAMYLPWLPWATRHKQDNFYLCWSPGIPVFAKTLATATIPINLATWLGNLGWHNTNVFCETACDSNSWQDIIVLALATLGNKARTGSFLFELRHPGMLVLAKTWATATWPINLATWLGNFGWHDTKVLFVKLPVAATRGKTVMYLPWLPWATRHEQDHFYLSCVTQGC